MAAPTMKSNYDIFTLIANNCEELRAMILKLRQSGQIDLETEQPAGMAEYHLLAAIKQARMAAGQRVMSAGGGDVG